MSSRLLLLLAALLWSSAGAAMKSSQLSGFQLAGGRSLIAGVFLFLAVRQARRLPNLEVVVTAIGYAATVTLFAIANKLTTAANAIFIQSTAPLWVVLLSSRWLGERATRAELMALPLYAIGLFSFFLDDFGPGQLTGNFVALAAGFAFATCIVGLRRIGDRGPSALVLGNGFAALAAAPLWIALPLPAAHDLWILLYLGVFQLGLSYLCFARGIRNTPALEASLLVLLEPVLNPVWTFLITGERPGPWALVGGSIVLSATLYRTLTPASGS